MFIKKFSGLCYKYLGLPENKKVKPKRDNQLRSVVKSTGSKYKI